ncbi:MAG TPA: hypothetical protein VM513_27700 [Kofleriaceae bacterium]|jgi:hypothetical protein|nr:hypothetical protein [Kofleriaceae bacterium]
MASTNAITVISVYHGGGDAPASVGERLNREESSPRQEAEALSRFFAAAAGGVRPCKVRVRTDSCVATQATLTLAVTQANIAVGEYLDIVIPGRGAYRVTAVTSGADVTLGQFVSQTSNAVTATNIAAAVNGMLGLKDWVTATTNSGNLILTANLYGTVGNGYTVLDGTVNGLSPAGGAFASGIDTSGQVTATIACVVANTDADDTVSIGGTTFTAKASGASGDNQFNLGASNTAMGDNLVAKINAHPDLLGLVTGVNASGTITLTFTVDPRVARHMVLQTSDADGLVITQATISRTLTNTVATRTYALGAP